MELARPKAAAGRQFFIGVYVCSTTLQHSAVKLWITITAHDDTLGEGRQAVSNRRARPTPSTWLSGGSHFGSWQRVAFTEVFIRQQQVTDNSTKGAVVKTEASTGGKKKINEGESAGKKGRHEGTCRYRGNAWLMSVFVCSWLMNDLKLMDKEKTGWLKKQNTNNSFQSLHCEVNSVWFVPTKSLSWKNRLNRERTSIDSSV